MRVFQRKSFSRVRANPREDTAKMQQFNKQISKINITSKKPQKTPFCNVESSSAYFSITDIQSCAFLFVSNTFLGSVEIAKYYHFVLLQVRTLTAKLSVNINFHVSLTSQEHYVTLSLRGFTFKCNYIQLWFVFQKYCNYLKKCFCDLWFYRQRKGG